MIFCFQQSKGFCRDKLNIAMVELNSAMMDLNAAMVEAQRDE